MKSTIKLVQNIVFIIFLPLVSMAQDRVELSADNIVEQIKQIPEGSHKFVLVDGKIIVSLTDQKKPKHEDLGSGQTVLTAGYIKFLTEESETDGPSKIFVEFDNKSGDYCPTFESLNLLSEFLKQSIGESVLLNPIDNPNTEKCK